MPRPDEFQIQRAFHWWFAGKKYPKNHALAGQWQIVPAKLPGVVAWHTPNGGKRDSFEAKRFAELGVLAGIPDYFALYGALHALEFKDDSGTLEPSQKFLHPLLIAAGAKLAVVRSVEAAKAQTISWGLVDSQHTNG